MADELPLPEEDVGDPPNIPTLVDEADFIVVSSAGEIEEQQLGETGIDLTEEPESDINLSKPSLPTDTIALPTRPLLRRDGSVPAPRQPPPPTPPPQIPEGEGNEGNPTDSLSLQQLRKIVAEIPRFEPTPYAFTYEDTASFPEELDEWFSYEQEEQARLLKAQSSFTQEWGVFNNCTFFEISGGDVNGCNWTAAEPYKRKQFIHLQLEGLKESDLDKRLRHLEALVYIALGTWWEAANLESTEYSISVGKKVVLGSSVSSPDEPTLPKDKDPYIKSGHHIQCIKEGTWMILRSAGVQPILNVIKLVFEREIDADSAKADTTTIRKEAEQRETWAAMTLLYICIEVVRTSSDNDQKLAIRKEFLTLKPDLVLELGKIINHMRWDDTVEVRLVRILLIYWKVVLLLLGGLQDVETVRDSFGEKKTDLNPPAMPLVTASPLEYHTFRQEISSKYPSYNPPPSVFPLEPEQKSILPPLRYQPTKTNTPTQPQHGSSILHQPVHIATPAPSPPPSPAAGKGGKRQDYQTNQLFPFLYPPLDATSNQLGGRGTTNLQDTLVGRRWEGSDIPTSISEASELFASRIRATRSLKQLWDERTEFMKFERGWTDVEDNIDVPSLDLESFKDEDRPTETISSEPKKIEDRLFDGSVTDRLDSVEALYRNGLPHLQSLVMVVIKTILANVTTLITQSNGGTNGAGTFNFQDGQNGSNGQNGAEGHGAPEVAELSLEDLEALRIQEITAKAASGLMLLLLKWSKVSHVLKFEYLTQLFVDANYIPMILKLLQTQEIEKMVNYRTDRPDHDFFAYCRAHSRNKSDPKSPEPLTVPEEDSEDEALPPPIKRHREEPTEPEEEEPKSSFPPEVDELGRNFYSSINFLRILQKVCKGKAHRNLMLVTYKSAAYLKKSLKVPQPELRLYTLKLFENQVPYCGRKWRQSNMRVITAVYLHCRPQLRDDWLCNTDVDADVEQSVPMEQALRTLTHWYNLKHYPKQMGAQPDVLKEEQDFFLRELDKIDWGEAENMAGDDMSVDQGWDRNLPLEHL